MGGEENKNLRPISELARSFGYNRDYLTQLIRRGDIAGEKVGKFWHSTNEAVAEFHKRIELAKKQRWGELSQLRKVKDLDVIARQSLAETPAHNSSQPPLTLRGGDTVLPLRVRGRQRELRTIKFLEEGTIFQLF